MNPRSSVRLFPYPRGEHFGKPMWCKWCDRPIPKVIDGKSSTQRLWHPGCVHELNLHTRLTTQFEFLVERDGKRCRMCPEGTPPPLKWLHDLYGHREFVDTRRFYAETPERLARLWPTDPAAGVRWSDRTAEQLAYGEHYRVWLECALQVDHRVPLWAVADLDDAERRWFFGPGNLWLLCPRHHADKTRAEAGLRARARRGEDVQLLLSIGGPKGPEA